MRFVVTGEWSRNRLLQTIVVLYVIYVAGLWVTNSLLYFNKMGLTASSVTAYYLGNEEQFLQPRTYQGLLEVTHFHGDPLDGCATDGQRRQQLGMAIALNHLIARRRRFQFQLTTHIPFDARIDVRKIAYGTRELTYGGAFKRRGNPLPVTLKFLVPDGELLSE